VSKFVSESSSRGQDRRTGPGSGDDSWARTPSLLALRALTRIAEQVPAAVARRAELSHNELRSLDLLSEQSRGPGELARFLGVSTAAASGIVDRLVEHGHAERTAHESDGRRTAVTISESGRRAVAAQLMPMWAELARLDADLTDDERAVVARYLEGATRALRTVL
jgi:DNA-binding MarR family transcriptional regulator